MSSQTPRRNSSRSEGKRAVSDEAGRVIQAPTQESTYQGFSGGEGINRDDDEIECEEEGHTPMTTATVEEASVKPKGGKRSGPTRADCIYPLHNGQVNLPHLHWAEEVAVFANRDRQDNLLSECARRSMLRDAVTFEMTKVRDLTVADYRALARTCSVGEGCKYSSEEIKHWKKDRLQDFVFGRTSEHEKDRESLIITGITKGVSRCRKHSDGKEYPYPRADVEGFIKSSGWNSKTENEDSPEMPIWKVYKEDGTFTISRMWQIADEDLKKITAYCSYRDIALSLQRLRIRQLPKGSPLPPLDLTRRVPIPRTGWTPLETTGGAVTVSDQQVLSLSRGSPASLLRPRRPVRFVQAPAPPRTTELPRTGNPHPPTDWRYSHTELFRDLKYDELTTMTRVSDQWSCWSCEKPVGGIERDNSTDNLFQWMLTNEYAKAMDDYVKYGTFLCEDQVCRDKRTAFMEKEDFHTVTCDNLRGCSTEFRIVNNDKGTAYFKLIDGLDGNKTYRLCSQPCKTWTYLDLAKKSCHFPNQDSGDVMSQGSGDEWPVVESSRSIG
ncbi:hypothetical protein I302_108008 [Kwoniella bestiolae CBS 10118]|uniref:Uncharacterized protein n=1 Tax=Kwoniella bestiolae CBS 10118 TaxID=1296100 RepID=A0A1B9FWX7_9TREE|nr:hypothetical protein I302_07627 [Kwoniella bestiolae CBS 10118]OCF23273.1 hypothetical protein I302_07627 [Kwoniella bestiolae CBS 10118]